jgi:hypothetical protein
MRQQVAEWFTANHNTINLYVLGAIPFLAAYLFWYIRHSIKEAEKNLDWIR